MGNMHGRTALSVTRVMLLDQVEGAIQKSFKMLLITRVRVIALWLSLVMVTEVINVTDLCEVWLH